jgi:hypothetical protein
LLLDISEALRKSIGAALLPFVKMWLDAAITDTRAALGSDTFDHARQSGRVLSPDDAVAEAVRQFLAQTVLEALDFPHRRCIHDTHPQLRSQPVRKDPRPAPADPGYVPSMTSWP